MKGEQQMVKQPAQAVDVKNINMKKRVASQENE